MESSTNLVASWVGSAEMLPVAIVLTPVLTEDILGIPIDEKWQSDGQHDQDEDLDEEMKCCVVTLREEVDDFTRSNCLSDERARDDQEVLDRERCVKRGDQKTHGE